MKIILLILTAAFLSLNYLFNSISSTISEFPNRRLQNYKVSKVVHTYSFTVAYF